MSLDENPTEQAPAQPAEKKSKKEQARDLALKYKDIPYAKARQKIMEEIPCSRSTATKALKWFEKQQATEKSSTGKPTIKVINEEKKQPQFISAPEEQPLEEISSTPDQPPAPPEFSPEDQEQLDMFKTMLEGLYVTLTAKGGLTDLLINAGVSEQMAKRTADQMYIWIKRRVTPETLQSYDTLLLIASHGTLIGALIQQAIKNREKKDK